MISAFQQTATLDSATNIPQKRVWGHPSHKACPQGSWKLRLFLAADVFEDSDVGLRTLHGLLTETGFSKFVLDANNTGYYLSFENTPEGTLLASVCFQNFHNSKVVTSAGSTVVLNFQRILDSEPVGQEMGWPRRSVGGQPPIRQLEESNPSEFERNNVTAVDRSPGFSTAPAALGPATHLPTRAHQPLSPRLAKSNASWSVPKDPGASSGVSSLEMERIGYEKVGYSCQPSAALYSVYPHPHPHPLQHPHPHPPMYGPPFHPPLPGHPRPFRAPLPGHGGIQSVNVPPGPGYEYYLSNRQIIIPPHGPQPTAILQPHIFHGSQYVPVGPAIPWGGDTSIQNFVHATPRIEPNPPTEQGSEKETALKIYMTKKNSRHHPDLIDALKALVSPPRLSTAEKTDSSGSPDSPKNPPNLTDGSLSKPSCFLAENSKGGWYKNVQLVIQPPQSLLDGAPRNFLRGEHHEARLHTATRGGYHRPAHLASMPTYHEMIGLALVGAVNQKLTSTDIRKWTQEFFPEAWASGKQPNLSAILCQHRAFEKEAMNQTDPKPPYFYRLTDEYRDHYMALAKRLSFPIWEPPIDESTKEVDFDLASSSEPNTATRVLTETPFYALEDDFETEEGNSSERVTDTLPQMASSGISWLNKRLDSQLYDRIEKAKERTKQERKRAQKQEQARKRKVASVPHNRNRVYVGYQQTTSTTMSHPLHGPQRLLRSNIVR